MSHEKDPSQLDADHSADESADAPANDADGTTKPGGLGSDGTIPADPDGVAAGLSDSSSHFNAEEDDSK